MKNIKNMFSTKLNKKVFPVLLAGFLLVGPVFTPIVSASIIPCDSTCADECAYVGQTETSGDSYRICGNYDSDCCYEWSQWYTDTPTCADECAYIGQRKCFDSTHYQVCGNYDSDCCYEWSSSQSCGSGQVCQNGTCVTQETNDPITGSLHVSSYSVCRGESISVTLTGQDDDGVVQLKLMVDDGANTYTFDCSGAQSCSHTWNITKSTAGTYKLTAKFFGEKPDGVTEVYSIDDIYIEFKACPINVDIKANGSDGPITIPYNSSANLTWTSSNADSCTASGAWSGTKPTSGSGSTGSLTSSKTYNINCSGPEGSSSDSVTVNISENNPPIADAGPNKEIYETESIILEGSGYDPDGDSISYSWACTGGTLSNPSIAQPAFYGPIVSSNTTYTCTLTVTDSHNTSDSDSVNILVKEHHCLTLSVSLSASPNSGCSPLNNVDLTASVSGTASGEVIYFFDCTNDGVWEKTITSGNSIYTASDICDYSSAGNYTAKIRVQREGLSAENTTQINVQNCYSAPSVDIKANGYDGPITISYNDSAELTWTSQNADSCTALGAWSGSKPTSGSEATGNLIYSKTYTITCSGSGGSDSDSVTINIGSQPTLYVDLEAIPSSGEAPLNNVDLKANVWGTAGGTINYKFDCTNNGSWDKEISGTSEDPYTAYDVCDYPMPGYYTAKVRAERDWAQPAEDTVTISVSQSNTAPEADAGPDREVYENETVTIYGSGYDPEGDLLSYSWSCSGGYLSNRYTARPIFTAPSVSSDRDYTCTLTVSDSEGLSDSDSMRISVRNTSYGSYPDVETEYATNIDDDRATLRGYLSDMGGSDSCKVWFQWGRTSSYGQSTSYSRKYDTGSFSKEISGLSSNTSYHFRAVAENDEELFYGEDRTFYTSGGGGYNNRPEADAGSDKEIYEDESTTLSGSGYDPDGGSLRYYWSCSGGSISDRYIARPRFTAPSVSSDRYFTCTLTVTDDEGLTDSDNMSVRVRERDDGGEDVSFDVSKAVKNITQGDATWYNALFANPGDKLLFRIRVTSDGEDKAYDVMVEDTLPAKIIYKGNLKVDDEYKSGDISEDAIDIGDLAPGTLRTITFEGEVASKYTFPYGRTDLINEARVYNSESSETDTCKIMVDRKEVAGATIISTGITDNIFKSLIIPLLAAFALVWLFSAKLIRFDKWVEGKKIQVRSDNASRILRKKIVQIQTRGLRI